MSHMPVLNMFSAIHDTCQNAFNAACVCVWNPVPREGSFEEEQQKTSCPDGEMS